MLNMRNWKQWFIDLKKYKYLAVIIILIKLYIVYTLFNSSSTFGASTTVLKSDILAIIVPGGGLLRNGSLPLYAMKRMDKAAELYHQYTQSGRNVRIITLSAGTTHRPYPLDNEMYPIFESTAGVQYLITKNITHTHLMEEMLSLDTIGNAYFLRAMHTEPAGYRDLIVITNNWHMKRVEAIFKHVFSLPNVAVSNGVTDNPYSLDFVEVDAYLPDDILNSRTKRETESLDNFQHHTGALFQTFEELHNWIYSQHNAYASTRLLKSRQHEILDEITMKTY